MEKLFSDRNGIPQAKDERAYPVAEFFDDRQDFESH
jgi:hypothetical protein